MRKKYLVLGLGIGLLVSVLMGAILYQNPAVQERVNWRLDRTFTYLRGVLHPVEPMPTPQAQALDLPTAAEPIPPVFATLQPSLTPTLPESSPTPATPLPSPTPKPTATPIPASVQLPAPAYVKQDPNNCGPASLAMYLEFYGWKGTQADIAAVIKPLPADRNVNVEELVYYARTHAGWLNTEYRVGGTLGLLKQLIAAGVPVVIEESFRFPPSEAAWPNDDLWAAHYLLLTGYDDGTQTFTGQDSYYGANKKVSYTDTDAGWEIFNRVFIMIYLPQEEATIKDILGPDWEVDSNRQRALATAQAEAQANPKDAFAWFNVGTNLVYFERYLEASNAYDTARTLGLPQRMLRYQFGPFISYFNASRIPDLLALSDYALERTPNSEEALLWNGWALYMQGKTEAAVAQWRKALKARPDYSDALYALNYAGAGP